MTDSKDQAMPVPSGDTSRPRLLLVSAYFAPRNYGGAVQLFDLILRRLHGFEVCVLTDRLGADAGQVEVFDRAAPTRRGYRVRRLDRLSLHFQSPWWPWRLWEIRSFYRDVGPAFDRAVAEFKPDVVVSGSSYRCGWLMNRLPASLVRVNYALGEDLTQQLEYGPVARHLRRAQVEAFRRADLNVFISHFTGDQLTRLAGIPSAKTCYVPCAIDLDRFEPPADRAALRERLAWSHHTVLLTVARLIPRKGVDQTLHALARARNLPHDWLYVVGGRGPEEERLKQLAVDLGFGEHVRFPGFVPDDQLPDLYGAADLFIQTNRAVEGDTEGFGIVFLEAAACGVCAIGGRAGGTADAIEDGVTGLLVDGDDLDAIVHALEHLLHDPAQRNRMARAALERARRQFGADVCAQRFEALMLDLLKGKKGAPAQGFRP